MQLNALFERQKEMLFKSHNWIEELEKRFPKESDSDFENQIYQNYKNRLNRIPTDPNCEFAWFYKTLKMSNKRLRLYNAFYFWLGLCFERPWKKQDLILNWPGYISIDSSRKVEHILMMLGLNYGISFPDGFFGGEKTFYLYKKRPLSTMSIIAIYTQPYSLFSSRIEYLSDSNRALHIIKNQTKIRKRDLAKKLKFKSDYCQLLIEGLKKEGRIKLKESSHKIR